MGGGGLFYLTNPCPFLAKRHLRWNAGLSGTTPFCNTSAFVFLFELTKLSVFVSNEKIMYIFHKITCFCIMFVQMHKITRFDRHPNYTFCIIFDVQMSFFRKYFYGKCFTWTIFLKSIDIIVKIETTKMVHFGSACFNCTYSLWFTMLRTNSFWFTLLHVH